MPLEFYNLLFINYAGCQDALVLNSMKQELNKVEKNLTEMVAKIIYQVSSNQTKERRLLEKKIENQTRELEGEIRASKEEQTLKLKRGINHLEHQTKEFEQELRK